MIGRGQETPNNNYSVVVFKTFNVTVCLTSTQLIPS